MFNRLKKLSGIGNAFFDSLSSSGVTPDYPPYGTELTRSSGVDYTDGFNVEIEGVIYYANTADFLTLADGFGGSYNIWENVTARPADTLIAPRGVDINITICPDGNCGPYQVEYGTEYAYWVGNGTDLYTTFDGFTLAYGDEITRDVNYYTENTSGGQVQFPDGNFVYNTTFQYAYFYDGSGGYYSDIIPESFGLFYPNEYPTGMQAYESFYISELEGTAYQTTWPTGRYADLFWDGSGGYGSTSYNGDYYAYGTEILSISSSINIFIPEWDNGNGGEFSNGKYDSYVYRNDGNGGYFISDYYNLGNYYPNGGWIGSSNIYPIVDGGSPVEVPVGSSNIFWNQRLVDRFVWNGAGGYTYTTVFEFYPFGEFIVMHNDINYYWDGFGGYWAST